MVLTDDHGQTDSNGSVADAVAYVLANPTSTVYRQTAGSDADHAPARESVTASK
jgi:hypothetical protein